MVVGKSTNRFRASLTALTALIIDPQPQVSALMPAAKSFLQFCGEWFPMPFTFGADEFEQAEILRRRTADWCRRFHCARSAAFMPLHRPSVAKLTGKLERSLQFHTEAT